MNERSYIYAMKGLAIFCVVCAHAAPVPEGTNTWNCLASDFLNYMGTMGVPIFYLLSGYLFERNKKKFGEFWRGKVSTVFVPWIFCGTLLWLYVVLRTDGITFKSWLLVILGYQQITYYMTVLIIMYVLFWGAKKEWEIIGLILFSVFSTLCSGWDFGITIVNRWTGTFYLNPLNWMAFFALGMLISRKNCLMNLAEKLEKVTPCTILTSILYFTVMKVVGGGVPSYFSKYALIGHIINLSLILGLAGKILKIPKNAKNAVIYVGKISFSIYLLHLLFVTGVLNKITNYFDIFVITLMRPFAIIFIVSIMVWLVEKVCERRFRFVKILIGLRK